jgi:hypothetical protein
MPDEKPEPTIDPVPIQVTQHLVHTVETLPAWTTFENYFLTTTAHVYGAVVKGDDVYFEFGNGSAHYRLHREMDPVNNGTLAELVASDSPAQLKAKLKKFEDAPLRRMQRAKVG